MESILKALFRGQLHPDEIIVPSHPEYRPLSRQIGAMTEKWRKELSDELFLELEEYSDLCLSAEQLACRSRLYSRVQTWRQHGH